MTVVDLAEGQLEGDRKAAEHYGYEVATCHGDMGDLSSLPREFFDLVYQGVGSLSYVPDIRRVYSEVARVLSAGGTYLVQVYQPAVFGVEWNGAAYCITRPYSEKTYRREDGGIEFRHYLSDIFNGLFDAGFTIERVYEEPSPEEKGVQAEPGSWSHQTAYVSEGFVIVARRLRS